MTLRLGTLNTMRVKENEKRKLRLVSIYRQGLENLKKIWCISSLFAILYMYNIYLYTMLCYNTILYICPNYYYYEYLRKSYKINKTTCSRRFNLHFYFWHCFSITNFMMASALKYSTDHWQTVMFNNRRRT